MFIVEVIFETPSDNFSVYAIDIQGFWEHPYHLKKMEGHTLMHNMALKLSLYF